MIFLKVLGLMTIFFTTTSMFAENKSPKVVVIGAGLAGLTTAYRLKQKGMDVHVYEARGRVGGRILTAKIDGKIAELGGQNIVDGGEAENIRCLMQELGLELEGDKVNLNHFYYTKEKLISLKKLLSDLQLDPEKLKAQLNDLVQRSKNMREILKGIFEEEDLLYKTLAVRLAAYEGGAIEKLSSLYAETLYSMLLGGISAVHPGNKEEEKYVHFLSVKGGNGLLPEKMAQTLNQGLHLNKPLKIVSKNGDNSYILTFQDDQKVKADILVLAIPCSVYEEIVFEDKVLPLETLEAIKNVHYGTNAKIIVPFSKSPLKRIGLINNHSLGFFNVDCSLLTLYYTGEASQFSSDTILHSYMRDRPMIEMGFEDRCPPFMAPVLAKDASFSTYEGPVGYSWTQDPYVKGSYSYIASGQETLLTATRKELGEIVKTLFAPIDQTLYFVGEHASILSKVPGTMEAACESGERIACMILCSLREHSTFE